MKLLSAKSISLGSTLLQELWALPSVLPDDAILNVQANGRGVQYLKRFGTTHHQERKDSMKLNISVSKPFSLSDNSDNNGFSQQLIILHIEKFRWYRSYPPKLRCFIFLYIVKLRWYRISQIQSCCKMPHVGIYPTSPTSRFRRFTTEPQLLLDTSHFLK